MNIRPHFTNPKLAKEWDDCQVIIDENQVIIDECDAIMPYIFLGTAVAMIVIPAILMAFALSETPHPELRIDPQLQEVEVFMGPPAPVPAGYIGTPLPKESDAE